MALTAKPGDKPTKFRVRTLRPWINVTRDTDGNPERAEVVIGEVIDVDRNLAGMLVSAGKAEAAPDANVGKPAKPAKAAAAQAAA